MLQQQQQMDLQAKTQQSTSTPISTTTTTMTATVPRAAAAVSSEVASSITTTTTTTSSATDSTAPSPLPTLPIEDQSLEWTPSGRSTLDRDLDKQNKQNKPLRITEESSALLARARAATARLEKEVLRPHVIETRVRSSFVTCDCFESITLLCGWLHWYVVGASIFKMFRQLLCSLIHTTVACGASSTADRDERHHGDDDGDGDDDRYGCVSNDDGNSDNNLRCVDVNGCRCRIARRRRCVIVSRFADDVVDDNIRTVVTFGRRRCADIDDDDRCAASR